MCWLACRTVFPVVIGRVVRTLQAQVKTFRYKAQVEFINQVGRQNISCLLLVALAVEGVQTVAGAHGVLRSDIQGVGLNPLAVDDTRTRERLRVHQVIKQIHFPATDATFVLNTSADVDRQLMPLAQVQVKVGAVVVALVREVRLRVLAQCLEQTVLVEHTQRHKVAGHLVAARNADVVLALQSHVFHHVVNPVNIGIDQWLVMILEMLQCLFRETRVVAVGHTCTVESGGIGIRVGKLNELRHRLQTPGC